jgi:hypothetical protein
MWLRTKRSKGLVGWHVIMRLLCFVCKGFVDPLFDLPFGFCLRCAIAFLDLASQRIHIAFNLLDVIVGEFAPLVTYASTQLLPVALNALRQELSFTFGSPFACIVETCYASLCFSLPPLKGGVVTYVTSYKRVHVEREGKHEKKREKETVLCA